ncbi:tRNA (cytosine(38)-C(5))-methyltransferase [Anabrus simplex]|uniref:tRNA (cytosine(38)-C(5))-methyltransferase n=1 Tax=Anabrus simplex TaxID=316456 RepID=UPI0035A38AC3
MKVLELYSGIGGMHYALNASGLEGHVVCAMDINTTANTVYKYNFPHTTLLPRNILSLSAKEIDNLEVNMILMSPPCQPFTRVGLKKDINDERTSSLLHILGLIPEVSDRLKYILLENVKGFETSQARNQLLSALEKANFTYQEFLLSPHQFGVPNTRHRYYLIAKRLPLNFCFEVGSLMETFPFHLSDYEDTNPLAAKIRELNLQPRSLVLKECEEKTDIINGLCYSVKHILEQDVSEQEYALTDKVLGKHGQLLDIVTPNSKRSCCFTKAYGHYIEGTGSVFCEFPLEKISEVYKQAEVYDSGNKELIDLLQSLKMRFFTPREIARLMCFPEEFNFPGEISKKQRYRLLGNSINVHVVSLLIALLTLDDDPP